MKDFKYKEWCPELYEELSAPFPKEAVQKSKGSQTGKGYDTTGYRSQFMVNRINELVGPQNWSDSYTLNKEREITTAKGVNGFDITVDVTVTILGVTKSSPGGHMGYKGHADVLKGACSNALKAALVKFGIGKQAKELSIDEDYEPINGTDEKPPTKPPAKDKKPAAAGNNGNSPITVEQHTRLADLRDELKLTPEEIKFIVKAALGKIKNAKDFTIIEANKVIAEINKFKKSRKEAALANV